MNQRKHKQTYKLHVVERGQGRPVILLHGIASTHRFWTDVLEGLDSNYGVITPDRHGHRGFASNL